MSFGTRHTLSDTLSDTRGIGAARRWIKMEFDRIAQASNGRMTVRFQESIVPPSQRVPSPSSVINVLATLRPAGAGPSAGRVIVVSGHYDSRASNPLDVKSDAPGADDDASGVALVIELARVMSQFEFDATIIFAPSPARNKACWVRRPLLSGRNSNPWILRRSSTMTWLAVRLTGWE